MGKKGKKRGDDPFDLPEQDEDDSTTTKHPADKVASKNKDNDEDMSETASQASSKAPSQQGGKKAPKAKGKGKKGKFDFDSDDEKDLSLEALAEGVPAVKSAEAAKGKPGAKVKKPVSAFDLLGEDDDEEEGSDEDDEDELQPPTKAAQPMIAEVVKVEKHPKADKLKVCSVDTGVATYQVVTNALNVQVDMKVAFAPVGCTLSSGMKIEKVELKGMASFGMLCSAHDVGWSAEADGKLLVLPDDADIGKPIPKTAPKGWLSVGDSSSKGGKKGKGKGAAEEEDEAEGAQQAAKKGKGKGKASASMDLDDEEEEAPAAKKSKGKGKGAASMDLDDEEEEAPAAKKGKGKGKGAASMDLDDEEDTAPKKGKGKGKGAASMDLDEEEPSPSSSKKGKGKAKGKGAAGGFAALAMDGEDEEVQEEEEEEVSPKKGKAKGKAKGTDAASAFAALAGDGDEEEEEELPAPKPSSSKSKSKGGKMASLFAALEEDAEAGAEEDEQEAPVAKDTKKGKAKSKGGKMDSLFAALEEDAAEPEEEEASTKKKAEKKKSSKDLDTAFAALAAESGEAEEAELGKSEEKKKKKKGKDMSGLFAALEEEASAEPSTSAATVAEDAEGAKPKKKKKDLSAAFAMLEEEAASTAVSEPAAGEKEKDKDKKKKKGKLDGLFDALEADAAAAAAPSTSTAPPPAPAVTAKGGKGKPGPSKAEEDELDALLAEIDGRGPPKEDPKANDKKAKKKDKKKAGAKEEEDIDALLAQIDGPSKPAPAAAAAAPAATAPADAAADAEDAAGEAEDGEDDGGEVGEGGKELTAAQKKKLKKKQKEKEKKAGGAAAADGEGGAEGDEGAAADKPTKKGKPVKESAAVKKLREEVERRKKLEEEMRAAEEARRKAEEEEFARLEAEEKARQEKRERLKEEKRKEREQLKKEGKLLTGKAKEEAERRERMRQQLLAQAAERGLALPTAEAEAVEEKKKKVVYTTKKQQKKKPEPGQEETAAGQEDLTRQASEAAAEVVEEQAQPEAPPQPAPAEPEPTAPPADEPSDDDWEAAADDWETLDEEGILPPAATKAAAPAPAAAAAAPAAKNTQAPVATAAAAATAKGAAATAKGAAAAAAATAAPAPSKGPAAAPAANGKAAAKDESEDEDEEDEESGEGSGEGSEEEESDEGSSDEGSSEEDSSDEGSSDEDSDSDSEMDSDDERQERIDKARARRLARVEEARANADNKILRSPICCILGHVDVGKTKILDNIRRTNVQDNEAGGITQQIGATFVPADAVEKRTAQLRGNREFDMKLPGLLIIDTPGHESFTNLRQRGSGLCDMAVLIVDLMHGLEQQTIESINLLRMRKTPFVIALNKVDRLYGWKSTPDLPIRDSFKRQKDFVEKEFETRSQDVFLQLNEQGLNVALYWKNPDPKTYVNVVPTSAITGEGIPDLLQIIVKLTQTHMQNKLAFSAETQCTVLEVKTVEGLGPTIDVILINGMLREGDKVVACGMQGPIVTRIRALKTPQVLKELRVKGQLMDHKEIRAAAGVKIVANHLEHAVAGTQLYVCGPDDDEEELKDAVQEDMEEILRRVNRQGEGVYVQASTLGSLEALLAFLNSDEVKIPVFAMNIGPVNKRDVMKANVMNEKKLKKYAVILAFDVNVSKEATQLAADLGVRVFTADIIYHLFDQFTAYMKEVRSKEQEEARLAAVFPCTLQIMPNCIFNMKDPIVVGVEVVEGVAKVGTPICVPSKSTTLPDGTKQPLTLGRIASMELNHKAVDTAKAGQSVAMKIEGQNPEEQQRLYGRHFDHKDELASLITRESIDALKDFFKDDMTRDDWRLVVKLKKVFGIA